jgi:nicotinate phosphoribosyltransferase
MDHFAVQATERPGVPLADSERAAFAALHRAFPRASVLLVDTYDTPRGIRHAVEATDGRLVGIRLDSNVTPEAVRQARALLDELGAREARILVSDRLDEDRVAELGAAGADAFGVGENITCSPDHATGIGAVAKIVVNGAGKITMKLSRGSGKATLPGRLQVYRASDHDLVATAEEAPPAGGRPLLAPLWRGRGPVEPGVPAAAWGEAARARLQSELARLPAHLRGRAVDHGRPWPIVVSDALAARIEACVKEVLA